MTKIIFPGAWELTATNPTSELYAIYVPTTWRQVVSNLAQQRARLQGKGYRAIPVYSLDPLISGSFPQIIKTVRNGWQKGNVPWLLATETTDISDLGNLIKDWLIEEFSTLQNVESQLANLNNDDWRWEDLQTYELLHPQNKVETGNLYQAIPDYLAKEFLQDPTVSFGVDEQYQLTFYRVVSLQGAELMSWPPSEVTVTKGKETTETAYISFVLEFVLQTVPWREKPIVYHHLSIRRWLTKPLNYVPYPGVKTHIGDNRRWLDGQRKPFCFIPLIMNRYGKEVKWPQAISNLFSLNDSQLPDANNFVSNPNHNWSGVNAIPSGIQAAIAYTSKLGDPPCLAGVSPQDLSSLDRAIAARLPVQRVGEAERVMGDVFIFWPSEKPKKKIVPLLTDEDNQFIKPKKARKSEDPNHSHTPMLRPKLAAPAVFHEVENPLRTILVLWETPQCRDALITEICQLLYLSPTNIENIYEGSYGSLCIKTQHVGELTQNLEIKNFSEVRKTYQQQRPDLLTERINKITAFLPQTKELSGALIEIRPKSFISEADPKLAWRIGAVKAGYLNQHIHRISYITKAGEEKLKKSGLEPVKRAVSDLLRQFGILPDTPLINPEKDGIDIDVWLTCFYVLRRTRKTNAENIPKTVVLVIRVNPLTAKVELATPDLFHVKGWVSYPFGLAHLSDEDWDSNYYDEINEELDDEQKRNEQTKEQRLINKFVAECLQECLNTPISDHKSPRVLFMAEAQNARKMLNWLQNQNLLTNDPLKTLKQHLSQEKINRLWIVRLRVADNGEVPVAIVKDSPGSRTSGVYRWQGVCDDGERSLYLSIRKGLNTEQDILRKWQSRLDNGNRQAGKARILEIVLIHHPEIASNKLAHFVHSLRSRWPYFANDVILPLPFPFAIKAKEYAVSTKDPLESSETDDSNF